MQGNNSSDKTLNGVCCEVVDCAYHHKKDCCCAPEITIDGKRATTSDNTICKTFKLK